jgi:hypothetical protein
MDLANSIASFSTAQAQAELQFKVAARILKISQDQGNVATQLVQAAVENLEEVVTGFAEGLGSGFDTYA